MTEQGTFYRRERIGENIKSAFLDAQNIDLYDNGRQNFDIGDDGFTNAALFNFKFTDPQPFGGGKLVGAEADLYLNSLNDGPSGLTATGVKVYKSNNLIETEGGLTNTSCLGLAGNKIYTNTAYQGYYQADISESFTDCVFGQMETDTFVSKTQIGKDPYLPFNIAYKNGQRYGLPAGDNSGLRHKAVSREDYKTHLASRGPEGDIVLIQGLNSKPTFGYNKLAAGVLAWAWPPARLAAAAYAVTQSGYHKPGETVWSVKEMKSLLADKEDKYLLSQVGRHIKFLNYETIVNQEQFTFESTMSPDNTIFDKIYGHDDIFGSDPEDRSKTSLMAKANIYPCLEGYSTGESAMCMETLWEPTNKYNENIKYGSKIGQDANPLSQEVYALLCDIPAPLDLQSREEQDGSTGTALNTGVVAPTIEITMNVKKLARPLLRLNWINDTSDSKDNQANDKAVSLDRMIVICLSEDKPGPNDKFYNFAKDHSDNNKNFFGLSMINYDNKLMMQELPEVFDTHNFSLVQDIFSDFTNPTFEACPDLLDKWFTLQLEMAPSKSTSGNDGKIIRSVYDPATNELLFPIRDLTSYSGSTDLTNNWPGNLSIWLINHPNIRGFTNDVKGGKFDLGVCLASDMANTPSVGDEEYVDVKKRVGSLSYTYANESQTDTDAFVFKVGERVVIGTEEMIVTDVRETSNTVTSGNVLATGVSQLRLSRGYDSTTIATHAEADADPKIYKILPCHSDFGLSQNQAAHSKVLIDNIKINGLNFKHINSTNRNITNASEDITILPETELIARSARSPSLMSTMASSTEWAAGSFSQNGLYDIGNQYLSFGFDTITDIHSSGLKYLFFSGLEKGSTTGTESFGDFLNISTASRLSTVRIGYSDEAVTNGGQYKNEVFQNNDGTTTNSKRGLQISTTTGDVRVNGDGTVTSNFTDGMKQAGLMAVNGGFEHSGSYSFEKRENIFCSARIVEILGKKQIRVDDPAPLFGAPDEGYIIYKYGAAHGTGTVRSTARPASSSNPDASGNALQIAKIENDIITFNNDITLADNNSTTLVSTTNLPLLLISPRRGWLIFEFSAGDPWDSPNKNRQTTQERTYQSVCQVVKDGSGNLPTAGATFSESLFTDDTIKTNVINRDIFNADNSTIELKTDYGFGALDANNPDAGYIAINSLNSGDTGKYITFKLDPLIEQDKLGEGDETALFYTTKSNVSSGYFNFDSEDGTNATKHWSVYFDELPKIDEFTVAPSETDAFKPEYKWKANDDDLWYGFLIASDTMISHQYHNSVAHIPLDENSSAASGIFSNGSTAASAASITNYKGGLAGYSKYFNGSSEYVKFGHAAISTKPTNKMAVVAHFIPDNTPSGDEYVIFKEDGSGSSVAARLEFAIYINSSGQVGAKVVSGSTTHSLLSSSIIPTDGDIPTCVILTVDGTLKSQNIKLFVNGDLEDTTGVRKTAGADAYWQTGATVGASGVSNNDLYIGCAYDGSSRANYFDGRIEEIVIYNEPIYPVSPNLKSFILDKPFKEQNNGAIRPITARLFFKDYHNIRGKTTSEVAASSMVSFAKPSFNLYG